MNMSYTVMREALSSMGRTHEQIEYMWNFCLALGHPLIKQLNRSGLHWTGLNEQALKTLEREYRYLGGRKLVRNETDIV